MRYMKVLINKLVFVAMFVFCMVIGAAAQSNDPKKPAPPKPKPPVIKPKPKPSPKKPPQESQFILVDGVGPKFLRN